MRGVGGVVCFVFFEGGRGFREIRVVEKKLEIYYRGRRGCKE